MCSVAYENQISAIERRNQVCIQRTPKMRAGKICNAEQMRNWISPVSHQRGNERFAGLGKIASIFRGLRKTLRIKLQVPDHVLRVDHHHAQCNAAADRMKLVEIVAGPANRALA